MEAFAGIVRGTRRPSRARTRRRTIFGLLLLSALALPACTKSQAEGERQRPAAAPVPVTVAVAGQEDVPVEIRAIARVEPYRTVTVRAQVAAQVSAIHFQEGDDVKAGDLLFSLDARPFEAALRQAEGMLAKDTALANDAELEARNQTDLRNRGVATQREYETALAAAASLAGQVQADQATVANTRLQVEYCSIRAPFDARTGSRLVNIGAVLKANETDLVVVNQLSPIYVTLSVPERHLADIQKYRAGGTLAVEAEIPQSSGPPERGELTFLDNRVDATTGMILLKGTFANAERRLWPGQFVNAALALTTRVGAVVVPAQAVQTGQTGQFVYVVKEDRTVVSQPVTTGPTLDGRVVIEQGVAAGETVVTNGQLRLVPGAKVEIKESPASAPGSHA
jgi:multidrug efflux system membrane fusion protein